MFEIGCPLFRLLAESFGVFSHVVPAAAYIINGTTYYLYVIFNDPYIGFEM